MSRHLPAARPAKHVGSAHGQSLSTSGAHPVDPPQARAARVHPHDGGRRRLARSGRGLRTRHRGRRQRQHPADRRDRRRRLLPVVQKHRLRALSTAARAAATAAAALALGAPAAQAGYTGTVDPSSHTANLTGSGIILLSTKDGLVHHDTLSGAGFESGTDFDSGTAGDQTVPDTGGWTVNVRADGKDQLLIDEEEPTNPLSFA